MARRVGAIDSLRTVTPSFVLVDAGDFTGNQEGVAEARSLFLLEMMGRFGYDAVTVGVGDLALGPDLLVSLASDGPVPIVSANVRVAATGKRLAPDRLVVARDGVRVGITAVTLPTESTRPRVAEAGFDIDEPLPAATAALRALRRESEVTVLLADGSRNAVRSMGEQLHGLADVIVVGDATGGRDLVQPEHGGSLYVSMGNRGQSLGLARVRLGADGTVDRMTGTEIVLGRDRVPDPEVTAMVDDFEDTLNDVLKSWAVKKARSHVAPDGHAYLGATTCASCHQREYRLWLETPHAHAFQTLEDAGRESFPECYRCHVTGTGDPTGYVPGDAEQAKLVGIQCEVCHGKGTRHARDGSYGAGLLMDKCRDCHDSDNSPLFDPDIYWRMIEH